MVFVWRIITIITGRNVYLSPDKCWPHVIAVEKSVYVHTKRRCSSAANPFDGNKHLLYSAVRISLRGVSCEPPFKSILRKIKGFQVPC